MLQRLLTTLLVSLIVHLGGGPVAVAATAHPSGTTIRFRTCLTENKPVKQDLKLEHHLSVRCRVPQVWKTGYPQNLNLSGSFPAPAASGSDSSRSAPAGADSAYILGLIYPFHGFL